MPRNPLHRLVTTPVCGLAAWLLVALPVVAAEPAVTPPQAVLAPVRPPVGGAARLGNLFTPPAGGAQEIQITSDSMDMNLSEHNAAFTGKVLVRDPRYQIRADKMIVRFGADQQPERIEALGNVQIDELEAKRRATAGRADYDVTKGTFVLTDKPVLSMGGDSMQGASKITYFRDNERVIFEGGADRRPTLRFTPKPGDTMPGLPGRDKNQAGNDAGATTTTSTAKGGSGHATTGNRP
ncbi:MAG: lipopolysaccharide transport periplasmic protein LptA [bacterium]